MGKGRGTLQVKRIFRTPGVSGHLEPPKDEQVKTGHCKVGEIWRTPSGSDGELL